VLISISSLKMARASTRSSAEVAGKGVWAMDAEGIQATAAQAQRAAIDKEKLYRRMTHCIARRGLRLR